MPKRQTETYDEYFARVHRESEAAVARERDLIGPLTPWALLFLGYLAYKKLTED